jgi:hypothetical protein
MNPESDRPPLEGALGRTTRIVLRGSIVISCVVLAVLVLDLLGGPRLPQAVRPALPFVLAVGLGVALVLGVAGYGAPKRRSGPGDDAPG